ncbi:MAG: SRPBCC family protein [Pseudomonadota bacterium]
MHCRHLLTQDIAGSVRAMSTLKLMARALLASLLWAGAAAWAEPDIRVERKQDFIHIEASLHIAAHHHVAWQVLTDYNNLASFVPGLQTSRIVSAAGEPMLLRQTGQSGFLWFSMPLEVVVRIREMPLVAILFDTVGGNLKSKSGEWRLEQLDDATLLTYRVHVVPGFWIPPLIGAAVIGQDVRNMLTSVAQEIQRRAAALTSAGAARIVQQ